MKFGPEKKVGQCRLWTPARLTELEEGHPNSRGIPPSASTYCIKMPDARLEGKSMVIPHGKGSVSRTAPRYFPRNIPTRSTARPRYLRPVPAHNRAPVLQRCRI